MEYDEAQQRLAYLKQALGSGLRGEEYKAVLQEYMQLREAIAQAGQQAPGQGQPGMPAGMGQAGGQQLWWQRRGGPSIL